MNLKRAAQHHMQPAVLRKAPDTQLMMFPVEISIRRDLLDGHAGTEQFQYHFDRITQTTNARLAVANLWV